MSPSNPQICCYKSTLSGIGKNQVVKKTGPRKTGRLDVVKNPGICHTMLSTVSSPWCIFGLYCLPTHSWRVPVDVLLCLSTPRFVCCPGASKAQCGDDLNNVEGVVETPVCVSYRYPPNWCRGVKLDRQVQTGALGANPECVQLACPALKFGVGASALCQRRLRRTERH